MALLNTLDAPATATKLTTWLADKLPDAQDIEVTGLDIPQSAGMSMTTILFKVTYAEGGGERELDLVARVAPETPGVFKRADLPKEFRVLKALGISTDIPVPNVRWVETDPSVLGSDFIVMDRVYGRVPPDDPPYTTAGWALELSPADRGKLYENALLVIDQIQAVDWQALGLEFLDEPEFGPMGIDQQIAHWEDSYEWSADGRPVPTIEAALEWAKANKPTGEDLVLNWGDPRIGNIIYGDDLSAQAVLDWETVTIASPEMELGWFVFFVRYYSEGIGVPIPEGFPTREQLVARWEELTGRTARHVEYYEAFAALRLSVLMCRAGNVMIAAGAIPPDNPMPYNNPCTQMLAGLLGLPAPEGESQNFIDSR